MMLYIENSKDSTWKLLELINEFRNVARYKINIQKSAVFLYTNSERSERACNLTISFKIVIKKIEINQTKEVKDLYAENYKTLIKEIKDDSKKWKNRPCS